MKKFQFICSILIVSLFYITGSSIAYAKPKKDDKSACLGEENLTTKCLKNNGYKCVRGGHINAIYCTKGDDEYMCDGQGNNCTPVPWGASAKDDDDKPNAPGQGPIAPGGGGIDDGRPNAPGQGPIAPVEPQKPDLIVDSIEMLGELVTRVNGFTYVPIEIRIANAGSANTTAPFEIRSGYYDYQDDVGPSSYIVPNQVNQKIEAGGVIVLNVDVAVPYPNGFESPFSINIELDSCSSDDANVDTSVCRIDEENEGNNTAEVVL